MAATFSGSGDTYQEETRVRMKPKPLHPDEYSFSLPDTMPMPGWNANKGRTSTPKGRRKSEGTNRAKALLRRMGL